MRGDLSSSLLAEALGVSAMAVRQHLCELEGGGDVSSTDVSIGKGRPTKRWTLTERANRHFVDRHRELVIDLFDELREALGPDDFGAVLIKRGERQVKWYRARIDRSLSLEEQVQTLVEIRDQEGYMAEVQEGPDGSFLLIENHCPICSAAKSCSKLCSVEFDVFRRSIGEGVLVKRVEHILEGSRRCVYQFSPKQARA
tara:strand:- start:213 stop:809 length:597 start_codon:yes stop_codon:yes gene_type:complete